MMVDRVLTRLEEKNPDLKVERIDIVTNPRRAWQNGIRMIPALQSEGRTLASIFLKRREIEEFIAGCAQEQKKGT